MMTEPFKMDHLMFVPDGRDGEHAFHMDGEFVGEFEIDEIRPDQYRARKMTFFGGMDDWRPMRCAAEARAFLVSVRKQ